MKLMKGLAGSIIVMSTAFGGAAMTTTGTLLSATALNLVVVSSAEAGCDWNCRQKKKEERKQRKEDRKIERQTRKADDARQRANDTIDAATNRQLPVGGVTQ